MRFFDWLNRQIFKSGSKGAVPDRSVTDDGRAPKGYWIAGPDEEQSAEEADEEYRRKYVYPEMTLHELLKLFDDDLVQAIRAKGLDPHLDQEGDVTFISDAMMKGKVTDEEFLLFSQLKHLRRLILRGTLLTDNGLAALEHMPQLEDLLIENSWESYRLSDEAIRHLAHLPKIKEFSLDGGIASGVGLRHVVDPETLQRLGFDQTPITDKGLAVISRFPNLERLRLWRQVEISDDGLKHLQKCRHLQEIDLALCDCQGITDIGVGYLAELPKLESLSLGDTNVTDACVDDLLRMPKLANVSFGDEKVTVESVRRLEAAGIEVQHGQLRGFRRESNVLRYLDVDFGIDQERSALRAYIHPERDDVTWELDIECLNEYLPEHIQPAHLEGPPIHFGKSWRELDGEEFQIAFDEAKLHPIMPGNPGNIYVGWHACPNNHVIRFLKRSGRKFLVDWTCEAKESVRDVGSNIWVNGEIPFTEVIVWSDTPLSLATAKQLASRHFDLAELDEPKTDVDQYDARYRFPVKSGIPLL